MNLVFTLNLSKFRGVSKSTISTFASQTNSIHGLTKGDKFVAPQLEPQAVEPETYLVLRQNFKSLQMQVRHIQSRLNANFSVKRSGIKNWRFSTRLRCAALSPHTDRLSDWRFIYEENANFFSQVLTPNVFLSSLLLSINLNSPFIVSDNYLLG